MATIRCDECGASSGSKSQFCTQCGFSLENEKSLTPIKKRNQGASSGDDQIIALLKANRKNAAIRLYKDQYGYDVDESKSAIERLIEQYNIQSSNNSSRIIFFLGFVIFLAAIGGAIAIVMLNTNTP